MVIGVYLRSFILSIVYSVPDLPLWRPMGSIVGEAPRNIKRTVMNVGICSNNSTKAVNCREVGILGQLML